jgi:hypothetical protein
MPQHTIPLPDLIYANGEAFHQMLGKAAQVSESTPLPSRGRTAQNSVLTAQGTKCVPVAWKYLLVQRECQVVHWPTHNAD